MIGLNSNYIKLFWGGKRFILTHKNKFFAMLELCKLSYTSFLLKNEYNFYGKSPIWRYIFLIKRNWLMAEGMWLKLVLILSYETICYWMEHNVMNKVWWRILNVFSNILYKIYFKTLKVQLYIIDSF